MKLSDHCYAVTGLGYMFPWSVNAGFIAGRDTTLIVDTGATSLAAATLHGYACAARPTNRLAVINTEKHFDHVGGNSYFRDLGIDVHGHAEIQRTAEEFRAEIDEYNARIPNPVRRGHREAEVFYHQTRVENPNRPISADTPLDLGACEIEIILTPGHTPTNLSVWVPSDRVLYCGDCLVNLYIPNLDAASADGWRSWLQSLDRIASLAPATIMPGHGPVVRGDDVNRLIAAVRAVLEEAIAKEISPTSLERARAGGLP